MGKFQLKSKFNENTTNVKLDHIWTNVPRNECKYGVAKKYWSDFHKLIYIAFKLLNTLPCITKNH
jgi:hypothetical protein